ncbi:MULTISPECIES: sugar phosphate isomerase/epimerase family protein [unclassified Ensifer]|jgi:sugar phosphate isomerase/epimerase|uniref:sugar phosphate isomerase/epimerase family protein n=1 Tax=unclassified Ensifer TaxID=2633371 RepID=UPI00070B8AA8|nr:MULTISPECIES: sugar phosphate isomerase/epimerase family protein [unclassified Ensifer]KQW55973.1 xylose isomerase [Ensifer sp. Root1252]KQW63845.1 xylose isomerase [Ensifer sp. Root127]KQY65216.1 xylose isomerase [Ensifer sp. Root142]KRC77451.1 xylose isomerase [Ensifer sp. Root231]KRC96282.1 xylose isomerase [Ensifer sp. Root258]
MRNFANDHRALALNTASLGHNLEGYGAGWSAERIIDACAERGLGAVVFWRREIGSQAFQIGERVRAAGMTVAGLCRTPFLVGSLASDARAVMDDFEASIDMAAALRAKVLTIVVGGVEPGTKGVEESLKIVADRVAEAAPYAAAHGIRLALEPLNPVYAGNRSCLTTLRDAIDLCDAIAAPNVGVAVDVYHVWWDTDVAAQLQRAGADRIFGFHLCDWLADTTDVLLDRGMMGDGVADLKALRKAVEGAGYSGPCEVEIFSANNWWKRDPGEVLDVMVERFCTVC